MGNDKKFLDQDRNFKWGQQKILDVSSGAAVTFFFFWERDLGYKEILDVYILLKMLAVLPVSAATSERSFSRLRQLKSYLRNTTFESQLNRLASLPTHWDIHKGRRNSWLIC